MELTARRLNRDNPLDWEEYPHFERRVRTFCDRYLMTETDQPKLCDELRARWLYHPQESGFWVLKDETGRLVGHVCSWVAAQWDKKHVFVYQFELDSWFDRPAVRECFRKFLEWVGELKLDTMEFQTPHDAKLFIRYLQQFGIESVKIRSVIRARMMPR